MFPDRVKPDPAERSTTCNDWLHIRSTVFESGMRGEPVPTTQRRSISQLTDREIDVLSLIAAGKRDREIAAELSITRATASTHVSHILDKLDVPNRAAAAVIAARNEATVAMRRVQRRS
jgi:DNA-binding NarL/FixJ family response regulator